MNDVIRAFLAVAKLETRQDVEQFDACLSKLNPSSLTREDVGDLLGAFDDKVEQIDVAWGLVHFVEGASMSVYVPALVGCADRLRVNAREWLETLVARCANSADYRVILIQSVSLASDECRAAIIATLRSLQMSSSDRAQASANQCLTALGETS